MRVVLADLKSTNGFVSKDTVAGGYGSRLRPFSKTAALVCIVKRRFHAPPSVQMAYLAALAAAKGHDTRWTSDPLVEGEVEEADRVAGRLGDDLFVGVQRGARRDQVEAVRAGQVPRIERHAQDPDDGE